MYRDLIINSFNDIVRKQSFADLKKLLGVKGEDELASFSCALNELREEGKLYFGEDETYRIFDESLGFKQGQIHINKGGIGFVKAIHKGKEISYMIKTKDLNGALPKDIVIIKPSEKSYYGHQQAKVEKVIKRDNFLEVYEYIGEGLFKPYGLNIDMNVLVTEKACKEIAPETLVLLEVSTEPEILDNEKYFSGNINKIIGHKNDPKIDELAISYKFGFDHHFSDRVMEAANQIPTEVLEEELEGRVDLRDKMVFTIDGKDTKDIDDAISLEIDGDNLILRASIADVSHYLLKYPCLIEEAIKRGNSAYFADSVVPMLPHILSNGICSLNPGVDRLTKTAELTFNSDGELIASDVYKSVIRSAKKMNYDDVNSILEDGIVPEGYEDFADNLILMEKLSKLATARRNAKGNLDFSDLEFKIHTAIDGTPTDLKRCIQRKGEHLIENYMIMANIVVTELYGYLGQPFVFRTHDIPDLIKLQKTIEVLKEQGIFTEKTVSNLLARLERAIQKNSDIKPNELQPLLKEARDNGIIDGVSNLLLRTMRKAGYSHINIGHFGLAEEDYCHFTSPIRRAADLMNHIIIDLVMEINYTTSDEEVMGIQEKLNMISKSLPNVCEHISDREIAADKAEREIDELKIVKYFIAHIEEYEGPILAEVLNSNKFGLRLLVDNKIKAILDAKELGKLGYTYMRNSRTYVRPKTNDCFKLGTKFYVFDPEASKELRIIKYNAAYTLEEYENRQEDFSYQKTLKRRNGTTK
ncbi:MAG: VacB/RNase II family 3'-5' exoribonuclease [Bacilli bacterium]|nr:VacB/RNase II family 3'-5' exoribonuclease [Bacilli bacterium]